MQLHYEHSLPAKKECTSKRKVLVFRHGLSRPWCKEDNGRVASSVPIKPKKRIWYGPPPIETQIILGKSLHTRQELAEMNAHE